MRRTKKAHTPLLQWLMNHSIRTQYMAAALLLTVAMLLGSTYVLVRVAFLSESDHLQNAQSDFENAYTSLAAFENRIFHLASLVQSNAAAVGILSESSEFSYSQYLRANQELLPLLYTLSDGSDDYFCRLYVDYQLSQVDSSSRILPLASIMDTSWAQEVMAGWGWWRFYSADLLDAQTPAMLAPIRSSSDNTRLVAIFRVDLNLDTLQSLLLAPQASSYTSCYLEDAQGHIIALSGQPLQGSVDGSLFADYDSFQAAEFNSFLSGSDTVFYQRLPTSHWRLTMVVWHNALHSLILPQLFLFTLGGMLMMILGILCAFPILALLIARIRRFYTHVQRYNEADAAEQLSLARLKPDANDEIGQLVTAHNTMLDRIDMLMNEKQARDEELRRLEISALQAQIKPHFLYNTLEAVSWMARMNQPEKVETTVRSLTRFYRLCLGKGCDLLPLSQELDIVENYFNIERMRYAQVFTLHVDVDAGLLDALLPKITLQPLVENALVHGILESGQGTGDIHLYTRVSPSGRAELCITDSGAHFSPDAFENAIVSDTRDGFDHAAEGYGIKNVERRLCLFFQKAKVLYLDTSDPSVTCLVLPLFTPAPSFPDKPVQEGNG